MLQTYRAIYENGALRLLDAVDLPDGTELRVVIDQHAIFKMLMGGVVSHFSDPSIPPLANEEEIMAELDDAFQGGKSIAELLDEEREDRF